LEEYHEIDKYENNVKERVLHPSSIAKEGGRSIQNISRALHEMEEKGIVKGIGEKSTWRKYLMTKKKKKVLDEVRKILDK